MDDIATVSTATVVSVCNIAIENATNTAKINDSANCVETAKETPTKKGNYESKNSSLEEDILGAHSLLMSDSDSSDNEESKTVEKTMNQVNSMEKQQESSLLVNSDDNKDNKNMFEAIQDKLDMIKTQASNDTEKFTIPRNEDDEDANSETHIAQKKKKKFSKILDSDSDENEANVTPKQSTIIKTKISALIDSESEGDEKKSQNELESFNGENKFKVYDFDSDSIDKDGSNVKKNKRKLSIKKQKKEKPHVMKPGLIDSDSESDRNEENENLTFHGEEIDSLQHMEMNNGESSDGKLSKPIRASAKKALDEIQAIQSEQQRLHREAHISVPYHKPKRYTLQEFLKRRTVIKPAVENECSPAAAILQKKNLKMTPEELEEYAKLMEERAKEATEFFKSESESEEELKENIGAMEIEEAEENNLEPIEKSIDEHKLITKSTDDEHVDTLNDKPIYPEIMTNEEMEVDTPEISSQPLVTEILQLPNLDLSTLHVNEKDKTPVSIQMTLPACPGINSTEQCNFEDIKKQIITEQILTESPTLKGNPNMIIDLESGNLIKKKPSGPDNLLKRLLATHRARKPKTDETVNILSTENGKLEMTKVNVHIHDEPSLNMEHKPGAAYVKLKENLKTLIKKKRLEEIKKRQEDENGYVKCLDGDDDGDEDNEDEYELEGDEKVKKKHRRNNTVIDDEENALEVCDVVDNEAEEEDDENTEGESVNELENNVNDDQENEEDDLENDENNDDEEINHPLEIDHDDDAKYKSTDSDKDSSESDDIDDDGNELKKNDVQVLLTTTQRSKNRIIRAFGADSDDDEDDRDLLKTQIQTVQSSNVPSSVFGFMDSPIKSSMSIPCTDVGVNNTQELLSLCSGSFDPTQNSTAAQTISSSDTVIISQIPMTQKSNLKDTSEELLELCSGNFDTTQNLNAAKISGASSVLSANSAIISQIPVTQHSNIKDTSEELLGLCSGTFEDRTDVVPNQQKEEDRVKSTGYKILSSDEEENNAAVDDGMQKRVKKLRKKLKKRQIKLGFSDDEEEYGDNATKQSVDNDNKENEDEVDDEVEDEIEVDMPETYVEYDSEENEIVVQMTKKDRLKHAENFFEKEAELSESDWGSADEDEKNMDEYDVEYGDEDEFDRSKLQQELGQIHARKMLDDDIREVRKIQELLFEDEENDGVGRQRQFRWKNAENGFSLDDMRAGGNGEDGVDGESGDDDQKQEHLWRKMRFEREQILKEQGLKENSEEFTTATIGINSPFTTIIAKNSVSKNTTPVFGSNGKRLQILSKTTTSTTSIKQNNGSPFFISSQSKTKTGSPFLISTTTKTTTMAGTMTPPTTSILQPKNMRGSFLTRDKDVLNKFTNSNKKNTITGFEGDETAGTVSLNRKNFVFTTLTKEEHEQLKRKADDLMNSSTETGTNFMKKPRMNTDKQCFIDQLLT